MRAPFGGFPFLVVCVEEDVESRHAAFARWVTPEIARLHGAARTLTHGGDTAEDLVQDTLVRAYRALCRFDGRHPRVVADHSAQRLLQGRGDGSEPSPSPMSRRSPKTTRLP